MNQFFNDTDDLSRYAPGVDSSTDLATLQPSFLTSRQKIIDMITPAVWEKIATDKPTGLLQSLLSAIANRVMYEHAIFLAIAKNSGEQRLHKYQHEEIKDTYISNFWSAMNSILQHLDSNPDYAGWSESKHYKQRQELLIKSADDFDYYYAIDNSPYFYYKIQFLIRKISLNEIKPRVKKLSLLDEYPNLADKIKRTLCYHVMAEAVMTFDLTELPRSIRYDFNHEYTKTSSTVQTREKLHDYFISQVRDWYKTIETEITLLKGAENVKTSQNKEDNNYYLTT